MLGLLWWTVVATPGIAVSVVFSATPQPESETSVQRQLPDAKSLARNNSGFKKRRRNSCEQLIWARPNNDSQY